MELGDLGCHPCGLGEQTTDVDSVHEEAAEQFVLTSIVAIDLSVGTMCNSTVNLDEKAPKEVAEIGKVDRNPAAAASLHHDRRLSREVNAVSTKLLNEQRFGPAACRPALPATEEHGSQDGRAACIAMFRSFVQVSKQFAMPYVGSPTIWTAERVLQGKLEFIGGDESPEVSQGSGDRGHAQRVERRHVRRGERAGPKSGRAPPRRVDGHGDVFESWPLGEPFEAVKSRGRSMTDCRVRSAALDVRVEAIEPLLFRVVGFMPDVDAPADPNQPLLSGFALERSRSDAVVGARCSEDGHLTTLAHPSR